MRTCLLIPTVLSLALVASHSPEASANTKYHFSGASCQPERASDVADYDPLTSLSRSHTASMNASLPGLPC